MPLSFVAPLAVTKPIEPLHKVMGLPAAPGSDCAPYSNTWGEAYSHALA
jgi:hypothetical protein